MKVALWRGYHSPALFGLLEDALAGRHLLILCPPLLDSTAFLDALPKGEVSCIGEWPAPLREVFLSKASRRTSRDDYPVLPHIGVFTSGTMGLAPRLVLFRRENAEAAIDSILSLFEKTSVTKIFGYPQPFHVFGLTLGYLHAMFRKREWVPVEGRYGRAFHANWRDIPDRGGLMTLGAPVHFHDLIEDTRASRASVGPSSTCIVGGAPVSLELWLQIRDTLGIAAPSIGYGATEACPGLAHLAPGRCPEEAGEIGVWLPGIRVETKAGEGLRFEGPNACLAMVDGDGRLEFPKAVLIRDEIATLPSGSLIYRGRTDWKLNRGGEKWSIEGIEAQLTATLGRPVVAVPVPDTRLGEDLALVAVTAGEDTQDRSKLLQCVKQRFGWELTEAHVRLIELLPVSANGKVDRAECRALFLSA